MSKAAIWVGYDLGVNGDYDGLYTWLAQQQAEECGDSLAFIRNYEYQGEIDAALRKDIAKAINLGKRVRIYAIWKDSKGNRRGRFLIGGRRQPPWHSYAPGAAGDVDDEG